MKQMKYIYVCVTLCVCRVCVMTLFIRMILIAMPACRRWRGFHLGCQVEEMSPQIH